MYYYYDVRFSRFIQNVTDGSVIGWFLVRMNVLIYLPMGAAPIFIINNALNYDANMGWDRH